MFWKMRPGFSWVSLLMAAAFMALEMTGRAMDAMVLVRADQVSSELVERWKAERYSAVALILEEEEKPRCQAAARMVHKAGLAVYFWIEVGRNPRLAAAHPEWMASLGMHNDWIKRFPNARLPKENVEVAKAFPWVPIHYRAAFDAHLARVAELLAEMGAFRGVLLNDLQSGPSSCGCGNLLCRWATDYQVPATGEALNPEKAAADFVSAIAKRWPEKEIIPVWTTECEEADLPAAKAPGGRSTGLCGTVSCAVGRCPKEFSTQWQAIATATDGPIGLLGLESELERAEGGAESMLEYALRVPAKHGAPEMPARRIWLVVDAAAESAARLDAVRKVAMQHGIARLIMAQTRIDQSYEPRIIRVK
ncbi:MAG: hypothetical protein AB1813_17150 [Verrucomicrobiota bacterium]